MGAVATAQQLNSVVGPTIWPVIYSLSLSATSSSSPAHRDSDHSINGSSGSAASTERGGGAHDGMPELVFYIATAWSLLGCLVSFTFPTMDDATLLRASQTLQAAEEHKTAACKAVDTRPSGELRDTSSSEGMRPARQSPLRIQRKRVGSNGGLDRQPVRGIVEPLLN